MPPVSLPDVSHVIHRGDVVVVTGNSNALNAVTSVLARNQIVARQLRVVALPVAIPLAAARFFR
jgi:uncharacterized transporter YbjL